MAPIDKYSISHMGVAIPTTSTWYTIYHEPRLPPENYLNRNPYYFSRIFNLFRHFISAFSLGGQLLLCTIMHHLVLPLNSTFGYIRNGHFISLDGYIACVGDIKQDHLIGPICAGASLRKYIWCLDGSSSGNTHIWSLFDPSAQRTKYQIIFCYSFLCDLWLWGYMVVHLTRTPQNERKGREDLLHSGAASFLTTV